MGQMQSNFQFLLQNNLYEEIYMKPLVSVIMPAYNAEKYISDAINSILEQTYDFFELIIVEDGSSDKTLEKIMQFKDKRIHVIRNNKNRGIAYSSNYGIQMCKGKYVALLDDDDMAFPNRLELQVEYMEKHPEIDILGGMSEDINSKGHHYRYGNVPRNNPKYIKAVLLFHCVDFRNGTAMIRKSFIEKNNLKYQDNCLGMQDYKFFIDSSKCGNISTIDYPLLKYRVHNESETNRSKREQANERAQLYAKFQRDSLLASGYKLKNEDLNIINKVLKETDGNCDNIEEIRLLRKALCEILRQAKKMNVDYYKELEIVCKKELSRKLMDFRMEEWF